MKYNTRLPISEEELPWPPCIPPGAKTLILGTFPSQLSRRKIDFYYPNPANRFWNILAALANTELGYFAGEEAVKERKEILNMLNAGVSSMGKRILRLGNSSLDGNILALEYLDVFRILDEHPSISKIVLTSSSGRSSTLAWFADYCKLNDTVFSFNKGPLPIISYFWFNSREIQVFIVNSTSGISSKSLDYLTEQYRVAICPC